ncbi:MAG: tyrosine-type recombinase/integrase [Desulfamplus sp.]|nr:tyrosine-type recombinase/integrase [Desulfamplus sp.]
MQVIDEYLQWMIAEGYSDGSVYSYEGALADFAGFVERQKIDWNAIFRLETFQDYHNEKRKGKPTYLHVLRGLAKYLYKRGVISDPTPCRKANRLPEIYEEYLSYCSDRQKSEKKISQTKRVLTALNAYLAKNDINLSDITILQIDAFDEELNSGYKLNTRNNYLTQLRGFMSYLHLERKILKTNLAKLINLPHTFSLAKPPIFVRPQELQRLFATLELSTPWHLRVHAVIYLAYTMGLRPKEILQITLDDISFQKCELRIRDRKCNNPSTLPIPPNTIKVIAAYLIGGRAASKRREVFLNTVSPYSPMSYSIFRRDIKKCMRKAGLPPEASPYWLRHTYAQNLLEAGVSIYEIKEMMGHKSIESTQQYLHIHIALMREVLFDDKI